MSKSKMLFASKVAVLALSSSVAAQSSDWSYEATIYLFAPETKTSIKTPAGKVEGALSFSDALRNLDMAFMGAFSASNGKWSFLADYMYTDLSFSSAPPGPVFSAVNSNITNQFLNGYVAYRVYSISSVQIDMAAGFRWFGTETSLTLSPGGPTQSADDDWTDPVIGTRLRFAMSERWSGTAFFDYGGFSSGSETWQALLTADYALTENWLLRGGYRYISVDHEINGNDFDFSQSGLIFGAAYRF